MLSNGFVEMLMLFIPMIITHKFTELYCDNVSVIESASYRQDHSCNKNPTHNA